MKVSELFEGISKAKAEEEFIFGGCGAFAIALQQKIGGEIFVMYRNGKAMHAYVKHDGKSYDVVGKRGELSMIRSMIGSSDTEGWETKGPFASDALPVKKCSQKKVDMAAEYIQDNPHLFK